MPAGRPTDYQEAYCEGARKLAQLGATDREIADFFDVNVATIYRWKQTHQEFCDALKVGKEAADARVVRSLYQRALGYSHDAVKIFPGTADTGPVQVPYVEHYPPDTTAAIFWLKNRMPSEWRDRQAVDHTSSDGTMTPQVVERVIIRPEAPCKD